nr:IS3 family transposase [Fretibacterium sp.]
VEAFFKFMKKEETQRRHFADEKEVKESVFSYIEGFYNSKRPHSANDMISPDEKESQFFGQSC